MQSFIIIFEDTNNTTQFYTDMQKQFSSLDSNYDYMLEYCFYFHTNDEEVKFRQDIFPIGLGKKFTENGKDIQQSMLASYILEKSYKHKGYHVFHTDLISISKVLKDFDRYFKDLYLDLINIVTSINEDLDKDSFIDFKRPLVLVVNPKIPA